MREDILEILRDIRPDIDFEDESQELVTDGVLESFDIVSLITALTDEFDITIRPKEVNPSNLNSVEAIMAMVERLMEG